MYTHARYNARSPDLDHVDVTARQESLTACQGQPVVVQLPLVPSYALTVHKTQASKNNVKRGDVELGARAPVDEEGHRHDHLPHTTWPALGACAVGARGTGEGEG